MSSTTPDTDTDTDDSTEPDLPRSYADGDALIREYASGNTYRVELTGSGFVKVTNTKTGRWTKVSFQSFVSLDGGAIAGVIQGGRDD